MHPPKVKKMCKNVNLSCQQTTNFCVYSKKDTAVNTAVSFLF